MQYHDRNVLAKWCVKGWKGANAHTYLKGNPRNQKSEEGVYSWHMK